MGKVVVLNRTGLTLKWDGKNGMDYFVMSAKEGVCVHDCVFVCVFW